LIAISQKKTGAVSGAGRGVAKRDGSAGAAAHHGARLGQVDEAGTAQRVAGDEHADYYARHHREDHLAANGRRTDADRLHGSTADGAKQVMDLKQKPAAFRAFKVGVSEC
jgi:hypothetical protein